MPSAFLVKKSNNPFTIFCQGIFINSFILVISLVLKSILKYMKILSMLLKIELIIFDILLIKVIKLSIILGIIMLASVIIKQTNKIKVIKIDNPRFLR